MIKSLFLLIAIMGFCTLMIDRLVFADPIEGDLEEIDLFGWSLAVGDFDGFNNGFGTDDLEIGHPSVSIGTSGAIAAGAVNVIYGLEGFGLTGLNNVKWHQGASGIVDNIEPQDFFSNSLAAGDFNKDGTDDLVIGVPQEDFGSTEDAG